MLDLINKLLEPDLGNDPDWATQELYHSLMYLVHLTDDEQSKLIYHRILYAVGNNHMGTYYPIVTDALPILLKVAFEHQHEIVRNCALEVITDLYLSFVSEIMGVASDYTEDELDTLVANEVESHLEQFQALLDNPAESDRNKALVKDIVAHIMKEASR